MSTSKNAMVTPIQAAARLGKPAPYIYQMIRDGRIPEEHITHIDKGDGTAKPMLLESFFDWFATRPVRTRKVNKADSLDASLVNLAKILDDTNDKRFKELADHIRAAITPVKDETASTVEASAEAAQG